ncbi:energy transducer TonB [Parabacteroides sp. FAFU027]|uniref:energy transducer TonB n=1 Tax=Parabacteroides sp. FAFU027 TaxID=2922715 RepID=UPI001FAF6BE9|nr:energy transducer TonB [Parabacteroides sp. FAFU027]
MAKRIQLHTFHLLFRLFSYLADKSGGWSMFVKPKLVIGALIISSGLTPTEKIFSQKNLSDSKTKQPTQLKKRSSSQAKTSDSTAKMQDMEETCYIIVEEMPEFPGGTDSLMKFLSKNIIYPKEAIEKKVEGMVICSFIINKRGHVSDIQITRSVNPLLDAEAVRVIKIMPKWKPGKQVGKPTSVKYTLPIRFTLPNK